MRRSHDDRVLGVDQEPAKLELLDRRCLHVTHTAEGGDGLGEGVGDEGAETLLGFPDLDDLETAKLLADADANVKMTNRYGVTPLSLACQNGNTSIVELLLERGADPNTILRGGETVLMTAARTGRTGPVNALLKRGADVNAKERRGQTALMWAAADGHTAVVELLIKADADMRLGPKVVNLRRLNLRDDGTQARSIRQVAIVQDKPNGLFMRVVIEMIDALSVEAA